jgi:hypothetical protein
MKGGRRKRVGRLVHEYNVLKAPRTVLPEFFGINSQDWPVRGVSAGGNGASAPSFTFGTLGTHDCSALHWAAIHTADGVYDWSKMDIAVTEMQTRGGQMYVSLYGTPAWLSQPAQSGVVAPYGHTGGGSYPTNLAKLAEFCTAMMARYNSVVRRIKYIQLWNEPENHTPFDGVAQTNEFWFGTAPEFVDTIATAYAALKAADPGVVCLSPGTYQTSAFITWNNAQGPVTGKFGRECYDWVAAHPYHGTPNYAYAGYGPTESIFQGGSRAMASALEQSGRLATTPIVVSEWGVDSASFASSAVTQAFVAETPAYRAQYYTRLLVASALNGDAMFLVFSYGNLFGNCAGDLAADTTGVVLGYQNAYNALANKTITAGTCGVDGTFHLKFSDGSTFSV